MDGIRQTCCGCMVNGVSNPPSTRALCAVDRRPVCRECETDASCGWHGAPVVHAGEGRAT